MFNINYGFHEEDPTSVETLESEDKYFFIDLQKTPQKYENSLNNTSGVLFVISGYFSAFFLGTD